MLTGRTRNPTKRSETARLHSKMVDGVRRDGFLHTAASTKNLPAMHIGISRALRPSASRAIDSEPIRARGIIFNYTPSPDILLQPSCQHLIL